MHEYQSTVALQKGIQLVHVCFKYILCLVDEVAFYY